MGLFNNIVDYFASNTFVQATENSVSANELENAIIDLNGRYKLGHTELGNYIKFGVNDDFPVILEKMLRQSPVHSGILTKKAKMIAGNDISFNDDFLSTKKSKQELKVFLNNCSGDNKGMYDVITHAAFQYEHKGACAFYVRWNTGRTKIVEFKSLDPKGVRAAEPNDKGDVTHYIVRRSFGYGSNSVQHNEPKKIKAFNKFDKTAKESVLYIANPYSGNPYYGVPNYISAFHYIASDFEFGKHIKNSSANGFTPKVLATFIGRNMSAEQKTIEYAKFKESFTGPEADNFIVSWVNKEEDAPKFTPLDIANLDKTIDVLSRLNDAKILTAHNITSPTLFGVMVSGKLGGTGNELVTAYQIFRATETLPNREVIIGGINRILSTIGFDKMDLSVVEEDINLESIKGANTTDIPNG
mgnify:FL=1|jgi:hypothetical protein|tara:strand:+ start:2675 stop:3916 length:1242 start_codon:yes stop_codon:yes gene_type:complete